MKKRHLVAVVAAGLGLTGGSIIGIGAPAQAAPESCGGPYHAAVEADSGQGVTYCSDGTFQDLGVPPTSDYESSCGGVYQVAVEADTGEGVSYCSDGTIDPFVDLLP